jgi:hypothetical protein
MPEQHPVLSISYEHFLQVLTDCCRQGFASLIEQAADQHIYAFQVLVPYYFGWIRLAVVTEEILDAHVQAQIQNELHFEQKFSLKNQLHRIVTPEQYRQIRRWILRHDGLNLSVGFDGPLLAFLEPISDALDLVMNAEIVNGSVDLSDAEIAAVEYAWSFRDALPVALQALDAEGTFGMGDVRKERVVLVIGDDDMPEDKLVKQLNPPEVFDRWSSEKAVAYSIWRDARRLRDEES